MKRASKYAVPSSSVWCWHCRKAMYLTAKGELKHIWVKDFENCKRKKLTKKRGVKKFYHASKMLKAIETGAVYGGKTFRAEGGNFYVRTV